MKEDAGGGGGTGPQMVLLAAPHESPDVPQLLQAGLFGLTLGP